MERRDFLKTTGLVCLGCLGLGAILQGCTTASHYANNTIEGNKIAVKKAEFAAVEEGKITNRKFVVVKNDQLPSPIYLHKFSETEYVALLMLCTHKGCEVNPHGDFLICPCHGSEFSTRGKVQNPPAEQDLKSYKVTLDNDTINIWL